MADFSKFTPILYELEKGYSEHPNDMGGATKDGITLATFRQFYGKDKTKEDLKDMTTHQWMHIMKSEFWDKCLADDIKDQALADIIVDWKVNSGMVAIRKIQMILSIIADGIFGKQTLAAVNSQNPKELFDRIVAARKQFYTDIVKRNPSQKVFMNGWMNRLSKFNYDKLK